MLTVFSHCTRSLGKALIQPSRCTHRAPLRQTTKTMECLWAVPAVTDLLGPRASVPTALGVVLVSGLLRRENMISTLTLSPVTRIEGHLAIHAEIEPIASGEQSTRPAGEPAAASSRPAADKQAGSKKGCRVKEAHCEGEMFRGIEKILEGRDPLDAQQITQRICGVCPISHGMASILAQQNAYGLKPTHNGRLLQNLIQGANYLQSHILHFYHLAALDFVDVKAILKYSGSDRLLGKLKAWVEQAVARKDVFPAAPFLPRYERDYVQDVGVNMSLLSHYVQALDMRRICHEMAAVFGARLPHSTAIVPGGCTQVPDI